MRLELAKACAAVACFVLAALGLATCEHTPAQRVVSAPTASIGALIAKPRLAQPNAAAMLALARTFAERPETVVMVRAMSGGAYLLEVVAPATHSELDSMLARMRASGEFEYVDLDLSGKASKS